MVQYNKEIKKKPYLASGGPRDQQRRQRQQDSGFVGDPTIVLELKKQITELRSELAKPKDYYTGEQVDDEIRKAVKSALQEVDNKNNSKELGELKQQLTESELKNTELSKQLIQLETKISGLTDVIISKDETIKSLNDKLQTEDKKDNSELNNQIKQLTAMLESGNFVIGEEMTIDDRPTIGDVVIDPTGETKLESHIDIKNVSFEQKTNMNDKVNKLKNLLGKLPSQKESDDSLDNCSE